MRALRRSLVVLGVTLGAVLASSLHPGAHASTPTALLPDLVADPPVYSGWLATDGTGSSTRLLLRFDGFIRNAGQGPLDIRGSRTSSSDSMHVLQRIYDSTGGFRDAPSPGRLIFESADGHNHWHLMHAARYSLWNDRRTAPAAPAMKVGFCLEDSEHVAAGGPAQPVYTDTDKPAPGQVSRHFCQQGQPQALSVAEGISPCWRDVYEASLAYQWVDASNVLPGRYWLRADVDPDNVLRESNEVNAPAYAQQASVIPGYVASAETPATVPADTTSTVSLDAQEFTAQGWADPQPPAVQIVDQPAHGQVDVVAGADALHPAVHYTPAPGYRGPDRFTYSLSDPYNQFPRHPAIATVALSVGDPSAQVAIGGSADHLDAGTSVDLRAAVAGDTGVTWSATAGTISPEGTYTAPATPPSGGSVTITATGRSGTVRDERTIVIDPSTAPTPAPDPATADPTSGGSSGAGSAAQPCGTAPRSTPPTSVSPPRKRPALSPLSVVRLGRRLIMHVTPGRSGRLHLVAYAGRRALGGCWTRTPGGRSFTCRITVPRRISPRGPVRLVATLQVGRRVVAVRERRVARVPLLHSH